MKLNRIIFADLSTYVPEESIAFYESVFGWKFYSDEGYFLAYIGDKPVVGLYKTPEKFKQMRMPHFWMTYFHVSDVEKTVEKARQLGGIIEMVQLDNPIGKVALIRDPQGAGFTLYEGEMLQNTRTKNEESTLIWNELHVSNVEDVIPFYEGILDWSFVEGKEGISHIYTKDEEHIADLMQIPNSIKGKYEYWVCTFAVENLKSAKGRILVHGGNIVVDEGSRILCTDHSGQAFFYIKEL